MPGIVKPKLVAKMEYEHTRGGKVVSLGEQFEDPEGRIHVLAKTPEGKLIKEVIYDKAGNALETIEGEASDVALEQ